MVAADAIVDSLPKTDDGQLFGAYFHQDWDIDAEDWPDVIDQFRRDHTPEYCDETASEIDRLIDEPLNNDDLYQYMWRKLGCEYMPRPDLGGPDVREWLRRVAVALRRQTAHVR